MILHMHGTGQIDPMRKDYRIEQQVAAEVVRLSAIKIAEAENQRQAAIEKSRVSAIEDRLAAVEAEAATEKSRVLAIEGRTAALEIRAGLAESFAIKLAARASALESQAAERDTPLYWLRRNWIIVVSILALNAAISGLVRL